MPQVPNKISIETQMAPLLDTDTMKLILMPINVNKGY